ncbi:MAG TPA: hypothetical protein VN436_00790, partial [Holophaga sp.]|nr:hypothetical protein [Holophaga sp.]
MKLDRGEVARYLGYRDQPLEPEVAALVDQCEAELFRIGAPRRLGRRMVISELPFAKESQDLRGHLRHCREAFLMVVTLGGETDRLLRRWAAANMGKAAVGQACAAAWMDRCCDDYLLELEGHLGEGEYLRPAYSPGYGDLSLRWQESLLSLLDARRRIGVTLTSGGMLVPEKTVT